jgi:hypothetical protein
MMITCSSCGQAIQADDAAYRARVPLYEPVTAPDGAPAARLVGYSERALCADCLTAIEQAAERRRAIRRAGVRHRK